MLLLLSGVSDYTRMPLNVSRQRRVLILCPANVDETRRLLVVIVILFLLKRRHHLIGHGGDFPTPRDDPDEFLITARARQATPFLLL